MEKVVTINLNGNPYQLDESAFDALRTYLGRAGEALAENPDKDEIIADLEQAIADRAGGFLGPGKSVVSYAEMTQILSEMGAVQDDRTGEGDTEAKPANHEEQPGAAASEKPSEKTARRLFRLPDGAMIAGIATGLAAYFKIDVTIIRLLFIALAIITHGWAILGYVVLMFVIPSAHTPEQWAAAHGAPFNAQEIIDRAKREYAEFTAQNGPPWSRAARRAARRASRAARRATRRAARYNYDWRAYAPRAYADASAASYPVNPITGAIAGLIALIFSIVGGALTIAFIVTLISLIATGAVLGLAPPANLPVWAAIVIVIVVFGIISSPIAAIRRGARAAMMGRAYYYNSAFDGIVWLALIGLGAWLTYLYVPSAHVWFDQAQIWLQHAWANLLASLPK